MNIAYAAGVFDGEGCVQFTRCRTTVYPRVLVTNTNLELLHFFKDTFGGDIQPLSKRQANWKQGYYWRLSWALAVDFLNQISPWLIVKRDHAVTIFAWDACRPGRGKDWDRDTVDLLVRRLAWLNMKGPLRGDDPAKEAANAT
jgi:hypothetical protein